MSHMMNKWFNYLIENKQYWCNGFTLIRLNKVKEYVTNDEYIKSDLLLRHGGNELYPHEMKIKNKKLFDHAITNLASSTLDKMIELKIYKIK